MVGILILAAIAWLVWLVWGGYGLLFLLVVVVVFGFVGWVLGDEESQPCSKSDNERPKEALANQKMALQTEYQDWLGPVDIRSFHRL